MSQGIFFKALCKICIYSTIGPVSYSFWRQGFSSGRPNRRGPRAIRGSGRSTTRGKIQSLSQWFNPNYPYVYLRMFYLWANGFTGGRLQWRFLTWDEWFNWSMDVLPALAVDGSWLELGNLLDYVTSALRIHRTSSRGGILVKYTGVL